MFNQLKDLDGGEIYLITSLLMFFAFFIVVTVYLLRISKKHIDTMSQLPLNETQLEEYEED